jgi:CHAD domain-containing protein
MTKTKKWEIKKLQKKLSFKKSSQIALGNRLKSTIRSIKKYLSENSVDNLHSMRIAIRRMRYGMELFIECFERKYFLMLYDSIVDLQDQSGEVRDLDVLLENIHKFKTENGITELTAIEKDILYKKEILGNTLDLKLKEFLGKDIVKDFKRLLA